MAPKGWLYILLWSSLTIECGLVLLLGNLNKIPLPSLPLLLSLFLFLSLSLSLSQSSYLCVYCKLNTLFRTILVVPPLKLIFLKGIFKYRNGFMPFPLGISVKGNENRLVRDLNSVPQVHFLLTITVTPCVHMHNLDSYEKRIYIYIYI